MTIFFWSELVRPRVHRMDDGFLCFSIKDFSPYVGNNSVIWKGVIWRNSLPNLNLNGIQLLDFCISHSLSITNTRQC